MQGKDINPARLSANMIRFRVLGGRGRGCYTHSAEVAIHSSQTPSLQLQERESRQVRDQESGKERVIWLVSPPPLLHRTPPSLRAEEQPTQRQVTSHYLTIIKASSTSLYHPAPPESQQAQGSSRNTLAQLC